MISGNGDGISISSSGISGATSSSNTVQGNFIGTAADGVTPLGNSGIGVTMFATNNNLIGGANAGEGNVIAFNGQVGVRNGGGGIGDAILGNSIFSNGILGISLTGSGNTPTANDAGDGDTGANNQQNYPVLSTVSKGGGFVLAAGTLNSTASTTFRLEFFANTACDPTGNGEGRTFLGAGDVTTDAGGNATFNNLSFPAAGGPVITATATVKTGVTTFTDTSEFSVCMSTLVPTLDLDANNVYDALTDGLLAIRYLFGLSGASLTTGAIGPGATRTTPDAITQYLNDIRLDLDIDGNNDVDALTDGLMIIRYLFGLRGASLITGAVGPGATRTLAPDIETYIQSLLPM